MGCEGLLLSSVWLLFVLFWMETLSAWLFLCHLAQEPPGIAFWHGAGAQRASGTDPLYYPFHIFYR